MTGLEFFLYGLLKAAFAGAIAGTVICMLILHWEDICAWFQSRSALKNSDVDNIGFSLQEQMADGKYKTVYGIFNTRTNEVRDSEVVSSQQVDQDLSDLHAGSNLVLVRS